jgi:hypothetical protein
MRKDFIGQIALTATLPVLLTENAYIECIGDIACTFDEGLNCDTGYGPLIGADNR